MLPKINNLRVMASPRNRDIMNMTTRAKTKKELTLLQAIERVVELSKDSKMSDEFMMKAAPEIGLLAESYGITERQAVLFCIS